MTCWCEQETNSTWCDLCNSCGEDRTCWWCTCPDILGKYASKVDKSRPDTWIVETKFVEVTSEDWTIDVQKSVTKDTITYDLSKACWLDKKVWACAQDTNPWYLFQDKIKTRPNNPLKMDLVNCPWNAYVEMYFDQSAVTWSDTDQKAAVQAWCDPMFLDDAIEVWNWLKKTISWCSMVIEPDCSNDCSNCNIQPKAKTWLVTSLSFLQQDHTEVKYYFTTNSIPALNTAWFIHKPVTWWSTYEYGWLTVSWWAFTVCRTGTYEVSHNWHQEQSKWIHATRVWLLAILPNGTIKTFTQTRYSWVRGNVLWDTVHFWDNVQTSIISNTWAFGWSLWLVLERLPVADTQWRPEVPSGTIIVPYAKISTYVDWDSSVAAWSYSFWIIGSTDNNSWWDDQFYISVRNIDTPCDCNNL